MLHISQMNTTTFRSKVSCEKFAAEKLAKTTKETMPKKSTEILNYINSYCKPAGEKVQVANSYLANEAAKTSSEKMAAEKLSRLTEVL